jgi:hypothetical protein
MEDPHAIMTPSDTSDSSFHPLSDKWTLWAHLPHDTNWNLDSYIDIDTFDTLEHAIALNETIPEKMLKNCMLFLMKSGIKPTWEDPSNRMGGCFSYKVSNKNVTEVWKKMYYLLIGKSVSKDKSFISAINGITISPKKNFCIVKLWMSNCNKQNPDLIDTNKIKHLNTSCLFKKHLPEF